MVWWDGFAVLPVAAGRAVLFSDVVVRRDQATLDRIRPWDQPDAADNDGFDLLVANVPPNCRV